MRLLSNRVLRFKIEYKDNGWTLSKETNLIKGGPQYIETLTVDSQEEILNMLDEDYGIEVSPTFSTRSIYISHRPAICKRLSKRITHYYYKKHT